MRRTDSATDGGARPRQTGFVLYVEGPRDRDLLRRWAHRLSPALSRSIADSAVILGGRRPARAVEHFRTRVGMRALCVLDRDGGGDEDGESLPGLEFFTWPRRHIESYLLVPEAIQRTLGLAVPDPRLSRLLREHIPAQEDEAAWLQVDAKRLLDPRGPLSRGLGRELAPSRIARAMRQAELHGDVLALLERIGRETGLAGARPAVIARAR